MHPSDRPSFWRQAFAVQGSITLYVLSDVLIFGLIAGVITIGAWLVEWETEVQIGLEVAPYEIAGAALGLLLVLRTNAGYDRWWEARKLWGGIVNQARNLVVDAMAYGPADRAWRTEFIHWIAAFPHVTRASLRGQKPPAEVVALLGPAEAERLAAADHMPSLVVLALARLLQEACDRHAMDRFAFLQLDRERALLIDHVGGCERILKTPLPLVYAIKIRQFIALFLLTLPLALLHKVESNWLIPIVTALVAYPLLSLDQIGIELQNPFSTANVSHLPLDDISRTITQNVTALLRAAPEE